MSNRSHHHCWESSMSNRKMADMSMSPVLLSPVCYPSLLHHHHLILRSVYTILYYMIPCVCPSALKVATLLTFQKLLKRQWWKTLILKLRNQQDDCSSSGLDLLGKLFSRLWEKFRSLCAHGLWSPDWRGIFFLWWKFPKKKYAMPLWKKERKKEKKT